MTSSTFGLIYQSQPCRVVTQRPARRLRGRGGYDVVLINYADGKLGEWIPSGQFFRAAKYAECGHSVSRCPCEPEF